MFSVFNKNAFQENAYHPLADVSGGGLNLGGGLPRDICIQGGLPRGRGLHPGGSASRQRSALGGLHPGGCASGGLYLEGLHPEEVCIQEVCLWGREGGWADPSPPSVNRMTHRCENITLSKTSFAGGKNHNCRHYMVSVP